MERKHKKSIIYILLALISALLIGFGYAYYRHSTTIFFAIDGEQVTSHHMTMEYEDNLRITPETIQLTATRNNKDVTNLIKVKKHNLTELKTYDIDFYIEEWDLALITIRVKIVDSTAPTISGESKYTLTQGDTFDESKLNLIASDIFDGNLSDKIVCNTKVDTSRVGEQNIVYSVEDSSGNKSEHTMVVQVKEKPVPVIQSSSNNAAHTVENPNDITVLINKNHKLPDGWAPADLTLIEGSQYLRSSAASSANQMLAAARSQGVTMYIVSSYRSQSYQINLFNSYMRNDPNNAPYYSAPPRSSEHELGLAIDISYDSQLHSDLNYSALGAWMDQHAHEYGWILRYPYGKTNVTGYYFEPWHYRYVGVDLATQIKARNITLEEYYQSY